MYEFTYKTEASDLWQMSMYYIYSNYIGIINVIFTVAMIALTVGTWKNTATVLKVILIFASCWFVVFQPVIMWRKAKKNAKKIRISTELKFSDKGMHVKVDNKTQDIAWNKIYKCTKLPSMIIIYSDAVHGYVLNNKTLNGRKKEFIEYVNQMCSKAA